MKYNSYYILFFIIVFSSCITEPTIAISENNEIWIDKRMIDIRAVRANVERLKAENPEGSVIIQADENSKTGLLVETMDQVRLAGVQNVSIAADKD